MAVGVHSANREEKVTRPYRSRIYRISDWLQVAHNLIAIRLDYLNYPLEIHLLTVAWSSGARARGTWLQTRERLPRHFSIIEMMPLSSDDLIILVTFSRDDDDVAGTRFAHRAKDRLPAVRQFQIRPSDAHHPYLDVVDDRYRALVAGIVGRDHR